MPESADAAQPLTILVADDDEGIRKVLRTFLERLNYRVVLANDGDEALAQLATCQARVVVSDMIMPNRSGLQLLADVKQRWPGIPFIIITGCPEVEAAVECMKHGAFDYITKPFDFARIKTVIGRAVDQAAESASGDAVRTVQSRLVGKYRIERVLGEGNVGVVFLATRDDDPAQIPVALKVLKQSFITQEERQRIVDRFLAEAEITASISHPNIIRILEYDVISQEALPYIVMEYFDGQPLSHFIESPERLDDRRKTIILRQVADALASIHDRGIYHRDIKPHNIMVNAALEVRLMDFGVARNPAAHLTADNELIGSPAYIAPEGFDARRIDHRADLFSFGVVAYELYLGVRPFKGETIPHFAHLIQHEKPLEPRKVRPDFPLFLQQVLARMLKKNPDDRYPSAAELRNDLDDFITGAARPRQRTLLEKLTRRQDLDWR